MPSRRLLLLLALVVGFAAVVAAVQLAARNSGPIAAVTTVAAPDVRSTPSAQVGSSSPSETGDVASVTPDRDVAADVPDTTATGDETGTTDTTSTDGGGAATATLAFAGDFGGGSGAQASYELVEELDPRALVLLGDISYGDRPPESEYCSWVHGLTDVPIALMAGNHDADGSQGHIEHFASCLPDQMGAQGDYGVQYWFDVGPVRVIAITPDIELLSGEREYEPGSPERDWLEDAVRTASGWVVVAHHKNCLNAATKDCEVGEELHDWLSRNADLVVMGHDHNYQRSHQLGCVIEGLVDEICVIDTDGNHRQGEGAVFVIVGTGGTSFREVDLSDPEAGYFATLAGTNTPGGIGPGVLLVAFTDDALVGEWASVAPNFSDSFMIAGAGRDVARTPRVGSIR